MITTEYSFCMHSQHCFGTCRKQLDNIEDTHWFSSPSVEETMKTGQRRPGPWYGNWLWWTEPRHHKKWRIITSWAVRNYRWQAEESDVPQSNRNRTPSRVRFVVSHMYESYIHVQQSELWESGNRVSHFYELCIGIYQSSELPELDLVYVDKQGRADIRHHCGPVDKLGRADMGPMEKQGRADTDIRCHLGPVKVRTGWYQACYKLLDLPNLDCLEVETKREEKEKLVSRVADRHTCAIEL
jgi:hypothetical protein